ncbi:MAG: hypothetical protein WCZ86_06265 [Desulfurivibrionaceae bacterium]
MTMYRVALLILAAIAQSQRDRPRFLQATGKPSCRACGKFWLATCRYGVVNLYQGDQPATDVLVFTGSVEEAIAYSSGILAGDVEPEPAPVDPTITEEAFILPPATFDPSEDQGLPADGQEDPGQAEGDEDAQWEADVLPQGEIQPSKLKELPADEPKP